MMAHGIRYLAFLGLLFIGSCGQHDPVELGHNYYFYYDGRGSDILHSTTYPASGTGHSIVPPTVSHYWSNDSIVLARRVSGRDLKVDFWVVLAAEPLTFGSKDTSGTNFPLNVMGPLDSLDFDRIKDSLGLQPAWRTGYSR
jgi:hypothetical protein